MPIPTTISWTPNMRLVKPAPGTLDWWAYHYNIMDILDKCVPRVFMAPSRVTTLAVSAGGALTADRWYYYKVVAFKDTLATWTLPSVETFGALTTTAGPNQTITATWTPVPGAQKYRVYRAGPYVSPTFPADGDYLQIVETTDPTVSYIDAGIAAAGAMPTTENWYVTELEQKYTMPDTTEATPGALVASGSCIDLRDNLANMRFMLKSVNGQASWLTAPTTNLYMITNGKAGGQAFTGGTAVGDNLDLWATSFTPTPTGKIRMNSPVDTLGNNLTIGAAGILTIGSGGITAAANVNIIKSITMTTDMAITMSGTATLTIGSGGITCAGDVNILKDTAWASGKNLTMVGAGTLTIGSGGITTAGTDVNIIKNIVMTSAQNITMSGASTLTVGTVGITSSGATVNIIKPIVMTLAQGISMSGAAQLTVGTGGIIASVGNVIMNSSVTMALGLSISMSGGGTLTIGTGGITPSAGNIIMNTSMTCHSLFPAADNTYNLGNGTGPIRWANAYITNLYLGDLNLDNGWKLDDHTDELLWISPKGKKYRMQFEEVN